MSAVKLAIALEDKNWTYKKGISRFYVEGPSWYDDCAGICEEEDARLISAAPALLKALVIHHNWCVKHQPGYSPSGDDRVAYRATVAAIYQAVTGERS